MRWRLWLAGREGMALDGVVLLNDTSDNPECVDGSAVDRVDSRPSI